MTCHRCGQPLSLVTYTVALWVADQEQATATLCSSCGGGFGDSPYLAAAHAELEG